MEGGRATDRSGLGGGGNRTVMNGGMGAMMSGMGLVWLLVIVAVVLAIAARLKYVLKG